MKGKTRFLLLVMALLLCLLPGAQADTGTCSESDDGQHSWVLYSEPATCTENGWQEWQCEKCYDSRDYETLPALGHNWSEWSTRVEATCTEGGTEYRQCSRCGETEFRNVDALGHSWDSGTITTAATCTADGVKTYTCTRCGTTRTESIPATGHTPVSIPGKAASCTESGLSEGSQCSVCGTALTAQQPIPATGHTAVTVPGKAATCTETGLTEGSQCSVCGTILTAQQTIPATGHTAVSVPGKAATCTEPGLTDGSQCSACGTVLTAQQTIPATGHTAVSIPGRVATCTVPGLTEGSQCSVCGTVLTAQQEIAATGHAWDGGTVMKEAGSLNPGETIYTCTRCGVTRTEEIPTSTFSINLMRNYPPIPEGTMGLRIVQQPEGGVLPKDRFVRITVEVEGGVGEYTYEWHCEYDNSLQEKDALFQQTGSFAEAVTGSYNRNKAGFASDFAKLVQSGSAASTSNSSAAYTFGGAIYEASQAPQNYDLSDHIMGTSKGNQYIAIWPGSYYCVIRDEAGNFVCSENAIVITGLYIAVQPTSRNIYGYDTVNLTCVAGGGSGPEKQSYTWYDAEGNMVCDQSVFPATKTGEYHCLVVDFGTDETVESNIVQVYSEEIDLRPVITLQPENVELAYREDGGYSWDMMCLALTYDGGSEDLEYEWQMYSKIYGLGVWWPAEKGETIQRNNSGGTLRCKVTDTRTGAYIYSDTAKVSVPMSVKAERIYGGELHPNRLEATIHGGVGPYTVKGYSRQIITKEKSEFLYYIKEIGEVTILESEKQEFITFLYDEFYTWFIYYNGEYYPNSCYKEYNVIVTDSKGNTCESGYFQFHN